MPSTFGSSLDIRVLGFLPDFPMNTYFTPMPINVWQLKLVWVHALLDLELLKRRPQGLRASATCLHCSGDVQNPANRRPTRHTPDPALLCLNIKIDATDFNMRKTACQLIQYHMAMNTQLDLFIFLQQL